MSLLGGFRADQLVNQLVAEQQPDSASAKKLVDRIKKIGPKVIPKAIDALALSDKSHTMVFVDILSSLVDDRSLEMYKEGLADGNDRPGYPEPGRCHCPGQSIARTGARP